MLAVNLFTFVTNLDSLEKSALLFRCNFCRCYSLVWISWIDVSANMSTEPNRQKESEGSTSDFLAKLAFIDSDSGSGRYFIDYRAFGCTGSLAFAILVNLRTAYSSHVAGNLWRSSAFRCAMLCSSVLKWFNLYLFSNYFLNFSFA